MLLQDCLQLGQSTFDHGKLLLYKYASEEVHDSFAIAVDQLHKQLHTIGYHIVYHVLLKLHKVDIRECTRSEMTVAYYPATHR